MTQEEMFNKQDEFLKELKEKFPRLYPERIWVEYGSGWYELIRSLSKEIYELYDSWGEKYSSVPYVVQMKEKFGGLRYYMWSGESEIEETDYKQLHDLVDKYERLSFTVCESCSKPGKNDVTEPDVIWYTTLCEDCRNERKNDSNNSNKV